MANTEHAQDAPQGRSADEDLRCLRPAFFMAAQVGAGLGQREVLL